MRFLVLGAHLVIRKKWRGSVAAKSLCGMAGGGGKSS